MLKPIKFPFETYQQWPMQNWRAGNNCCRDLFISCIDKFIAFMWFGQLIMMPNIKRLNSVQCCSMGKQNIMNSSHYYKISGEVTITRSIVTMNTKCDMTAIFLISIRFSEYDSFFNCLNFRQIRNARYFTGYLSYISDDYLSEGWQLKNMLFL